MTNGAHEYECGGTKQIWEPSVKATEHHIVSRTCSAFRERRQNPLLDCLNAGRGVRGRESGMRGGVQRFHNPRQFVCQTQEGIRNLRVFFSPFFFTTSLC